MPRGGHKLTRGAWRIQTGVTEAAWRRLWGPWWLPGEPPRSAWETSRDHFGANVDAKLDHVAANVFEAVFLKLFS